MCISPKVHKLLVVIIRWITKIEEKPAVGLKASPLGFNSYFLVDTSEFIWPKLSGLCKICTAVTLLLEICRSKSNYY